MNLYNITEERIEILKDFAIRSDSEYVILFLYDNKQNESKLLVSYCIPASENIKDTMKKEYISLSSREEYYFAKNSTTISLKEKIYSLISRCYIDVKNMQLSPLILPDTAPSIIATEDFRNVEIDKKVGLIVHNSRHKIPDPINDSMIAILYENLSHSIQLSRYRRFFNSVFYIRKYFDDLESNQGKNFNTDKLSTEAGRLLQLIGGAEDAFICRDLNYKILQKLPPITENYPPSRYVIQPLDSQHTTELTIQEIVFKIQMNTGSRMFDAIKVPISMNSYQLCAQEFCDSSTFTVGLETTIDEDFFYIFTKSNNSTYLQLCFSNNDIFALRAALNFIQVKLSEFDLKVKIDQAMKFLQKINSLDVKVHSLHESLKEISPNFVSLTEFSIFQIDARIAYNSITTTGNTREKEVALFVLQSDFFKSSHIFSNEKYFDNCLYGFFSFDNQNFIKIYFPKTHNTGKVYLIEINSKSIRSTSLQALFNIFNELFLRFRKDNQSKAQADYLVLAKHSIMNSASSIHGQIESLIEQSDFARKHPSQIGSLVHSEDFFQALDVAHVNIASLLRTLRGGHFLLDNINSNSLKIGEISIIDITRSCLTFHKPMINEKKITVRYAVFGGHEPIITGDKALIEALISNLIDNAIKYSPKNSIVYISISFTNSQYTFEINSSGELIDPKVSSLLFLPGYRYNSMDKEENSTGSGFGLALAQKIVTSHAPQSQIFHKIIHDHKIVLSSVNCFSFSLPCEVRKGTVMHDERETR
ncbi:MAG: sensor histidine kinase [Rhodospirillaceae bacterium]